MALDVLKRLASPLREFGLWAGSLYLLDRLLGSLSPHLGLRVYDFMVQPIGSKPLLPEKLSKNLDARAIVQGSPELADMPAREDIKAERFAQGAHCLGAYRKGQLIGYMWYAKHRHQEDEVRCDYVLAEPASSVFDFDFYVLPQHRLGLGFVGVWHCANQVLSAQGVRYTFSRLTVYNTASRRAHDRLGWQRVGWGLFIKAWGAELMFASLAPYLGVTFRASQRITLTLRPDVLLAATRPSSA
jgi:Acetyltransferase (GNAT) family